jgi:hypothetical protein
VPSQPDAPREALAPLLAQLKNAILEKRKSLLALPVF